MRLIDADRLQYDFINTITENSDTFDWLNMINRQPTAYDVDHVIDRIEIIADKENDKILSSDCPQYHDGVEDGLNIAIRIIKEGD